MVPSRVPEATIASAIEGILPGFSLDLRYPAVISIFACGVCGSFLPLFIASAAQVNSVLSVLLRGFGGGVILSLAIVHILPDSFEDLDAAGFFPTLKGAWILLGVFLMLVTDVIVHALCAQGHTCVHSSRSAPKQPVPQSSCCPQSQPCTVDLCHPELEPLISHVQIQQGSARQRLRAIASAYATELGCVLHSLLIGLALGVAVESGKGHVDMVVALSVHQALEGISLGTIVAAAQLNRYKNYAMLITYSIVAPIGICLGIAAAHIYSFQAGLIIIWRGILNAISGGMLVYISLLQLLGQDVQHVLVGPGDWGTKTGFLASTVLGAGLMCALNVWV